MACLIFIVLLQGFALKIKDFKQLMLFRSFETNIWSCNEMC